jgi:hypothetical protein
MTPEIYAEWLRRQGQRVIRTESSYWHSEGMRVFQAFPYHWLIAPEAEELRELTFRHHALALRYSMAAHGGQNVDDCYHVVYIGADYDFETLGANARNNVRRGLKNCSVFPISIERYVEDGWALRLNTLARQQRQIQESKQDWGRRYTLASDLDGFEVWAAEVEGRLGATLVTFQMDGWAYMLYQQSHSDYLREHVNNALSFAVTRTLIRRSHIRGIFYGMRSLDAPASVDEFKFRMGYEAKAITQRIAFHPCVGPLINQYTHQATRYLSARSPGSRFLAKAEGMLRYSLAGRNISLKAPDTARAVPESKRECQGMNLD